MKDELITSKTAKLAKEKGFDIKSKHWYDMPSLGGILIEDGSFYDKSTYNTYKKECATYAPTQSLLQRWLREKHGIHLGIWFNSSTEKYSPEAYGCKRLDNILEDFDEFETYEEALEVALHEALKFIKIIK